MENYFLRCQENKQIICAVQATDSKDVYEVLVVNDEINKSIYDSIYQLMINRATFALMDCEGSIVSQDLTVKYCGFDKNKPLTVNLFQLKRP